MTRNNKNGVLFNSGHHVSLMILLNEVTRDNGYVIPQNTMIFFIDVETAIISFPVMYGFPR